MTHSLTAVYKQHMDRMKLQSHSLNLYKSVVTVLVRISVLMCISSQENYFSFSLSIKACCCRQTWNDGGVVVMLVWVIADCVPL